MAAADEGNADPLLARAREALHAGDLAHAERACRLVLAEHPRHSEAVCLLTTVALRAGNAGAAVQISAAGLKHARKNVRLLGLHGQALSLQGNHAGALSAFRRALDLRPDQPGLHMNVGVALGSLGRNSDAILAHRRAIALDPRLAAAHANLGNALRIAGCHEEAAESYARAVELSPADAQIRFNRGLSLLMLGELACAWGDYGWRLQALRGGVVGATAEPAGLRAAPEAMVGVPLAGARIMTLPEQGLGDEIFFLRFGRVLKAAGAWWAHRPSAMLAPIMQRVCDLDAMVMPADPEPAVDHRLLIGDLPRALGVTSVEALPPPLPVAASPEASARARAALYQLGDRRPWIGVTWRAGLAAPPVPNLEHVTLSKRLEPAVIGRALRPWAKGVVILQRNPTPAELAEFGASLGYAAPDLSGANADLDWMLGILEMLDEYIGVSNTNMHLRAGTGRSAQVLIPNPPEWRWMARGAVSPWFPEFATLRQTPQGSWDDALAQLDAALRARFPPDGRGG